MDPTIRKPKPNPSAAAAKNHRHHHHHLRHLHPLPDPTVNPPPPPPPSTIQNISHRFSKLYSNHKKFVSHSFKPDPHPQPDPHFKTHIKDLTFSPALDSSCTTLTKSSSQKEKITKFVDKNQFLSSKTKIVKEKDDFRKDCVKKDPKRSSFEECNVMSKSFELEVVKGLEEGLDEGKRRSSVSSIPPPIVVNGGGRRRSFCNSQVELADFLSCSGVKVVAVDMPPFMQIHAVNCARKTHDSLEKFTSKTLAFTLKKEFDGVYGPAWHCIVGTSFGSFVTHSVGGFMYFSMDHKLYILLFKTTVQRAE